MWTVNKWKKNQSRFLYHMKEQLAQFSDKKNGWWGATPSMTALEQNRLSRKI